jgi:hypothetical protein
VHCSIRADAAAANEAATAPPCDYRSIGVVVPVVRCAEVEIEDDALSRIFKNILIITLTKVALFIIGGS